MKSHRSTEKRLDAAATNVRLYGLFGRWLAAEIVRRSVGAADVRARVGARKQAARRRRRRQTAVVLLVVGAGLAVVLPAKHPWS